MCEVWGPNRRSEIRQVEQKVTKETKTDPRRKIDRVTEATELRHGVHGVQTGRKRRRGYERVSEWRFVETL